MIRYVVIVKTVRGLNPRCPGAGPDVYEYSTVQHKTKREAMHELAVAKTDRTVARAWIDEREVIYRDNS